MNFTDLQRWEAHYKAEVVRHGKRYGPKHYYTRAAELGLQRVGGQLHAMRKRHGQMMLNALGGRKPPI